MRRKLDVATLRAAWWTLVSCHRARTRLARDPLADVIRELPGPPPLPDAAERGVIAVLGRREETCLVRSIVRQSWDVAHGRPREIIVGVTAPSGGFKAHAWLDGDSGPSVERYREIARWAAR